MLSGEDPLPLRFYITFNDNCSLTDSLEAFEILSAIRSFTHVISFGSLHDEGGESLRDSCLWDKVKAIGLSFSQYLCRQRLKLFHLIFYYNSQVG